MKQFISFVIKEAKHIVRDKRTMLILFGMPIVMMLLFGFAITNDIKNVRIIIVTSNADYATQQATDRLAASEFFTIAKVVATPSEAEQSIRNQEADMAIVFSQDFASKKSGFQLIVDGADPNMAQQWSNYASAVLMNPKENSINTKLLYNPQMKSAYNFVPGIIGTCNYGYAPNADLCHDDFYFHRPRKRKRNYGSITGFTHAPPDDYHC